MFHGTFKTAKNALATLEDAIGSKRAHLFCVVRIKLAVRRDYDLGRNELYGIVLRKDAKKAGTVVEPKARKPVTHRYRIRLGRRLYIDSIQFKGKRIVKLSLTETEKFGIVFESDRPKWATTDLDQKIRAALSEAPFNMSWADIRFVAA